MRQSGRSAGENGAERSPLPLDIPSASRINAATRGSAANGLSAGQASPKALERLVAETQFATDLVLGGLRQLCTVPMNPRFLDGIGYDQTYPLHVGLFYFTSGLERLGKMAIRCHGLITDGTFAAAKKLSHRLDALLDALELLDLRGVNACAGNPLARPRDGLDPDLANYLTTFASGAGRYEHLDALTSPSSGHLVLQGWVDLCGRTSISDPIRRSMAVRDGAAEGVRDHLTRADFETLADPFLEIASLHEASIGAALALYERARWAAALLDTLTYNTHCDLPILGEVLVVLEADPEDFFRSQIARLGDEDVAVEALTASLAWGTPVWSSETE